MPILIFLDMNFLWFEYWMFLERLAKKGVTCINIKTYFLGDVSLPYYYILLCVSSFLYSSNFIIFVATS